MVLRIALVCCCHGYLIEISYRGAGIVGICSCRLAKLGIQGSVRVQANIGRYEIGTYLLEDVIACGVASKFSIALHLATGVWFDCRDLKLAVPTNPRRC